MVKRFLFYLFHFFVFSTVAQNLVPNSSFENFTQIFGAEYNETKFDSCLVNCWVSPTHTNGNYLSSSHPEINNYPIYNNSIWEGEQMARTGFNKAVIQQVVGQLFNNLDSTNDIRNYLQTQLVNPLQAGQSYTFKMYVSSGYDQNSNVCFNALPSKNLGVHFSEVRPLGTIGSSERLDLVPQLSFSGINFYNIPNGWIELSANYVAQGGEEFLTIGNFDYFINTEFQLDEPSGVPSLPVDPTCIGGTYGLIAIDDVSLIPVGSNDTTERRLNLGSDTTFCGPFQHILTANSGYSSYFWSTGETSQSITITQPGVYWCRTHEFCNSCADTIVISQIDYQSILLGNDTVFCSDDFGSITFNVNSNFDSYNWNTGDTTASITVYSSGIYWVTGVYVCGVATDTIELTVHPSPEPPITNDTTVCQNESLIGAATGSNLTWYESLSATSGQSNPPDLSTASVGQYQVYVSQKINECESSKTSYTVNVITPPFFYLEDSISQCAWQEVYLGPDNQNWNYFWQDNYFGSPRIITESARIITESGDYILVATNQCGSESDTAHVIFESCDCNFYLPNAFTPNGDEFNQIYKPVFDCVITSYEFKLYNRWGELVFVTEDPLSGWDGTYNGLPVGDGIFGFQLIYTDRKTNVLHIKAGHAVLQR